VQYRFVSGADQRRISPGRLFKFSPENFPNATFRLLRTAKGVWSGEVSTQWANLRGDVNANALA
jgi:hypothetical protein